MLQYERAVRFADGSEAAVVADLCDSLSRQQSLLDRWVDAAEVAERALALWRQVGDPVRESDTLRFLSRVMWRLNRGADGLGYAESALEALHDLGESASLARAYSDLAIAKHNASDVEGALVLLAEAERLADLLGLPDVLSEALNTESAIQADRGGDWFPTMQRALEVALAAGLDAQAGRSYADGTDPSPLGLDLDGLPAPHRLSLLGRHEEAAQAWDRLFAPFDAALALYAAGTEESLREALRRFEALGATAAAATTRRQMRRIGVRSVPSGARPATKAHPKGLTPREREVLGLLCERLINEEIAERLVISVKTVDHHVSAVLGKIFCLVEAPSAEAASTVHREAHGLVAQEIVEVREGREPP